MRFFLVLLVGCFSFSLFADVSSADFEAKESSDLSQVANLKMSLYYMGANEEVFNIFAENSSLQYHQEFGGFIAKKRFFEPNSNHTNLTKAYDFCRKLISLEEEKSNSDWSLIRDYRIVLSSIIIEANKSGIRLVENQSEILKVLIEKIYSENLKKHSIEHYFAMAAAFYGYLEYSGIVIDKDVEDAYVIASNKNVLPYWINFYYGYMLPKNKDFALIILNENAKDKNLSALLDLVDIYEGLYDSKDRDIEKSDFYKKQYLENLDEFSKQRIQEYKKYLKEHLQDKTPDSYFKELSMLGNSKDAQFFNKLNEMLECLKILYLSEL